MNPKKLIIRVAGLANHALAKTHWPLFYTLTYREGEEWSPKHISRFVNRYRDYISRNKATKGQKLVHIWTTEMQQRGAVHYHGIMWIPNSIKPKQLGKPDDKGWWPYGSTNVQKAISPAGYIAKYLTKATHEFPKGLRRYAIQVRSIMCIDFLRIPNWMAYFSQWGDRIFRLKGLGWYNQRTGECYESPYYFTACHELRCKPYIMQWESWKVSQALLAQTGVPF